LGVARQYQGELPSQLPSSGSQGLHWVPGLHPPAATPFAEDQHSPPILTGAAKVVVVVGALVVVGGALVVFRALCDGPEDDVDLEVVTHVSS